MQLIQKGLKNRKPSQSKDYKGFCEPYRFILESNIRISRKFS